MGRNLEENKLRVHYKKGHHAITINKSLTKQIYDAGYKFVYLDDLVEGSEGTRLYLRLKKEEIAYGSRIHFVIGNYDKQLYGASICSKAMVEKICARYNLDEGEYTFSITGFYHGEPEVEIWYFEQFKKVCTKCGKFKPMSEFYRRGNNGLQSHCKECMKEHGRLRNGTTGVYREPPKVEIEDLFSEKDKVLFKFRTEELIEHIRMRGELHPEMLWDELEKQGCYIEDNKLKIKTVRVISGWKEEK